MVTLYRAVSEAEWDDIRLIAGFRGRPEGGTMEVKLFATSFEDAEWWGHRLYRRGGASFMIVKVDVPDRLAMGLYRSQADGRSYLAIDDDLLSAFNAAVEIEIV